MARPVEIVVHTHWDREWYAPFESFQAKLVEVIDAVLDALEDDQRWRGFHLDGQVAAADDYLALRPECVGRFTDLVRTGRIAVGPWYVLMDEFCVSGETILRNLEMGIDASVRLGGVSEIGYLPDMFGHVAQMPQMLRMAGIGDAVVWRGVPASVDRNAFWWAAPDGSEVRAEYLTIGYASGAFLPQEAEGLVRRVAALEAESEDFLLSRSAPLLLMNGTDHQPIRAGLPDTVEAANGLQERYSMSLTTLRDYLGSATCEGLPRWQGELRSGARAPILMGVLSARADIKAAAAETERRLESLAEPLAALWLPPDLWPEETLGRAWLEVVRNSAHDSICGCSTDEVGRAVHHRYDSANALADGVVAKAIGIAGVATAASGPLVVNPSARKRSSIVQLTIPGALPPVGTQQLSVLPAGREERQGRGGDLGRLLGELTCDGWLGTGGGPTSAAVGIDSTGVRIDLTWDMCARPEIPTASTLAEAWALCGAHRDDPLHVTVVRRASQVVLARAGDVPGFGWSVWAPGPLQVEAVEVTGRRMSNGVVEVEVDAADGTFSLNGVPGFGRLVEDGDDGDTYNYCPPDTDVVVDTPMGVEVRVLEYGPLRGRIEISSDYEWPERVDGGRRAGRRRVTVVTELELRAGESMLRVSSRFDNACRDHRVRVWLPLPNQTDVVTADCAFATVERSGAEGGPRETGLATYPARRFVQAGGLTVTHESVLEHELVDGGRALAVTILRSIGVLSRPALKTRPNVAGPDLAVEDAQMIGPRRVRYALCTDGSDPWLLAEHAWIPVVVTEAQGVGHLPARGSRLEIYGGEVSALRRRDGYLEIRVFNPTPEATTVRIPGRNGTLVDLRRRDLIRWDGEFELGPWKIVNARLSNVSLD